MNPNQCSSVGSSKISESISSTDSIATSLSSTGSVDASTTNLSTPNLNVTSQSASPAGDTVAGLHGVHLSSHGHGHSRGHGHYGHGLGHGPVHSVPSFGPRPLNGSSRRQLVHSVSIIVEPVPDGDDDTLADVGIERPSISNERRNTIAGPIIFEDFQFGKLKLLILTIFFMPRMQIA